MQTDWTSDASSRRHLVDTYVRWVKGRADQDRWADDTVHDAIWNTVEPDYMLEFIIEVIGHLAGDARALNFVGAGPLEDLLGGTEAVMMRSAQEGLVNAAFRVALATVYSVRYNAPGFQTLHDLTIEEQASLPMREP